MSCTCQICGKQYKIDLIIPDGLWEIIRPDGKAKGAGLICSSCIMRRLETLDYYSAYQLITSPKTNEEKEIFNQYLAKKKENYIKRMKEKNLTSRFTQTK